MDSGVEQTRELPQEIDTKTNTRDILARETRYQKEKGFNDWTIVDVDAHHSEMSSWREVVEYLDDPILKHYANEFQARTGGAPGLSNHMPGLRYQDAGGRIPHQTHIGEAVDDSVHHRDVTLIRRSMDAMGLDHQILFPGNLLQLGTHPQPRVEAQLALAYNRWVCERILPVDERVKTLLYLPISEPDMCMKMIKEFGDNPNVSGFMITSVRFKPVHHNQFIPIYRELEERGLPLAFHAGLTWGDDWMKQLDLFISMHAISFVLCNIVHMTNWIIHGMQERFPKLDVIWIESGLAWLAFLMQRLDSEYLMRPSEAPLLKKLPSEYMADMYYTCQPIETSNMALTEETFKAVNAETQLLYASDWPHWDFNPPSTIYDLPFLDEKAKRNILGENAVRLFDIDTKKPKTA
ncbi:MAG: amidohydrolase family protein [Alphaproteobacteria bacterium]|nr:amidohydrolase family protein [Alphaproteobacteria bacterium]